MQASKPRPVKTLPPAEAVAIAPRPGSAAPSLRRARRARGSTRIARRPPDRPLGGAALVRRRASPGRPRGGRAARTSRGCCAEPVDRPGRRRLDPLAVEVDGARRGRAGPRRAPDRAERQRGEHQWEQQSLWSAASAHRCSRYNRIGTRKVAAPPLAQANAPSWIRTSGLSLRRGSLYPAELSGLQSWDFPLVAGSVRKSSIWRTTWRI